MKAGLDVLVQKRNLATNKNGDERSFISEELVKGFK
jgi:hypothetical protein